MRRTSARRRERCAKKASANVNAVLVENDSLRRALKAKQEKLRPPPSAFTGKLVDPPMPPVARPMSAKAQAAQAATAEKRGAPGAPSASLREASKLREENKSLRQQVLQLASLVRSKDAELSELRFELGQRAPMRAEVDGALKQTIGAIRTEPPARRRSTRERR